MKFKVGDKVKVTRKNFIMEPRDIFNGVVIAKQKLADLWLVEAFNTIGLYEISPKWCIEAPALVVGDRVKITCGGEIFRFHETWVKENVYDDDLRLYWAYGQNPYFKDGASIKTDDTFIIKVIADDKAFIQRSGIFETECYVIGLEGIKKC